MAIVVTTASSRLLLAGSVLEPIFFESRPRLFLRVSRAEPALSAPLARDRPAMIAEARRPVEGAACGDSRGDSFIPPSAFRYASRTDFRNVIAFFPAGLTC